MLDAPEGQPYIPGEGAEVELPRWTHLRVDVGERVVALPAEPVLEVLTARPYGRIPGADPAIAGVVNRRGRILTVVDLGIALGDRPTRANPEHRILVLAWRGREVGLAVKDVLQFSVEAEGLREIDPESLLAPLFGGDAPAGGEGGESTLERS